MIKIGTSGICFCPRAAGLLVPVLHRWPPPYRAVHPAILGMGRELTAATAVTSRYGMTPDRDPGLNGQIPEQGITSPGVRMFAAPWGQKLAQGVIMHVEDETLHSG